MYVPFMMYLNLIPHSGAFISRYRKVQAVETQPTTGGAFVFFFCISLQSHAIPSSSFMSSLRTGDTAMTKTYLSYA